VLIVDRGGGACEIIDLIYLEQDGVNHVMPKDLETGIRQKMGDIASGAGKVVVQADHLRSGIQQAVAEVAPQKTGSSGYNDSFGSQRIF
jgi:hypothetical protein